MKRSGFTTVRISLETLDPLRQRTTGDKVSTDDVRKALRYLRRNGFTKAETGVYLLYGLPGQRLEEVKEGVEFLMDRNVRIHLAEFSPIRGTGSWADLVQRGIISDDLDPLLTNNSVFSSLFSDYDRDELARLKLKVKEYNTVKGRARNG
jgi:molybdenum cofactor biosynthesis enzyme MoaA